MILIVLTACKYEEGPWASLRSKKHRVVRQWQMEKAFVDGADQTDYYKQQFNGYNIEFTKGHDYKLWYGYRYESGGWTFNNNKTSIILSTDNNYGPPDSRQLKILRLKEHELWLMDSVYNKNVELHLH